MDPDLLRTFLAIAETGSFTHAAERVGRTQSAVSQQVKRLEAVVQRTLFRRSSAGVRLTEHGERLKPHARKILAAEADALAAFDRSEMTGLVSLGVPEIFAETLLPRVLPRFQELYPRATISLQIRETYSLMQRLRSGALDLAFATDGEVENMQGPVVLREEVIWIAPKLQPLEFQEELPVVVWRDGSNYRRIILEALANAGRSHRVAVSTQSVGGMVAAVACGLGVAVVGRCNLTGSVRAIPEAADLPKLPDVRVRLERTSTRSEVLIDRLHQHLMDSLT